jgi:alpha-D-ribose 1-methylphosphonate 5-triphosphate synthase subunit PhnH
MMLPGLVDPTLDSQRIFRSVLEAISHPGRIVNVTTAIPVPAPLHPAAAGICLTLLDFDAPLWLDAASGHADVVEWLKFHCGVPVVDRPAAARFALITDAERMPPLQAFDAGSAERPERSTTLIIQVHTLIGGTGRRLTGPGIASEARLDVAGVPPAFWTWVGDNHARFPCGVDVFVSAGQVVAALPRTTRVED